MEEKIGELTVAELRPLIYVQVTRALDAFFLKPGTAFGAEQSRPRPVVDGASMPVTPAPDKAWKNIFEICMIQDAQERARWQSENFVYDIGKMSPKAITDLYQEQLKTPEIFQVKFIRRDD